MSEPTEIRCVLLFSGHMVDRIDRKSPRFPAAKVPAAKAAIESELDRLGAGPDDLAIASGACGGDLLFAEACLARGTRLELHLPFVESRFLEESVNFAGAQWTRRFTEAKQDRGTRLLVLPEQPEDPAGTPNPFERCNLWMLDSALRHGAERLHFVCLWDGRGGDGPGGTQHMVQEIIRCGGQVHRIDITAL